jgi:hypothetical protein
MRFRPVAIGLTSFLIFGLSTSSSSGSRASAASGALDAAGAVAKAATAAVAADPQDIYAQKLPVPDETPSGPDGELMVMAVRNASVPSASEVGVPAYPGARILATMAAGAMTQKSLPALAMLSTDDIAAVLQFYQEKLAGWEHWEMIGNHMFWDGPEDSNPMDITGSFPLVGIVSVEESSTEAAIWPGVKTRIDIRYRAEGE